MEQTPARETRTYEKNTDVAFIFKSVLAALDIKANQFAERLGVHPQNVYAYTTGMKSPNWDRLAQIKREFPNVSGDFLLTGKGPVLLE